jgi:hypothetical protein
MFRLSTLVLCTVIGSILLYAAVPSSSDLAIVLTQVHSRDALHEAPSLTGIPACDKAQVSILIPGAKPRPLTEGFYSACDPDVSFDGQRILFAGKQAAADNWNIFEIGADGSGLRQITKGLGDCRNPLYLSTLYTLISDKPWHQIAFISNMAKTSGEYGQWVVTSIYSTRLDGTGLMRLTHGPSGDLDPFQMPDGRLVFSGWRPYRPEKPGRLPLFAVNIDGTDFMLLSDAEGRPYKRMPCITTNGLVVFVESEQVRPDGVGNLACVSLRRNFHSYRQITRPGEGLFRFPTPAPDGKVLVSRQPDDGKGTFGICLLDPDSGALETLFDDPNHEEIQAKILAPRSEPDGRSTSVLRRTGEIEDPHALEKDDKKSGPKEIPSGRLYCLDVYNAGFASPAKLPKGIVKRVRVLEGLLPPVVALPAHKGSAVKSRCSPGITDGYSLKRRFIGEAPVEADGSFNLHVPANIPIELQILDSDGLALGRCSWIWVKNNEPRGCIGCHEDPELVPENQLVAAIAKPSHELVLPPERRRSVDFLHDVGPIIQSRCVSCHKTGGIKPWLAGTGDPARTPGSNHTDGAYEELLEQTEKGNPARFSGGKYVTPGSARTSALIWHLLGRNTSRPWDPKASHTAPRQMPAGDGDVLTEEEQLTFIEWIDTGAHWDTRSAQRPAVQGRNSRGSSKP